MAILRILVMEDDAVVSILLTETLEGMGHEVCAVAATEADSITAAARHKPDLIIVDARLGEGSGILAIDEILRTGPIPHIFVSGDSTSLRARKPRALILQKPFLESELALAIQQAWEAGVGFHGKLTPG